MSVAMSYDIGCSPHLLDQVSVSTSYDIGAHTRNMLTLIGTNVGTDKDALSSNLVDRFPYQ
eukprot:1742224-Karenia_brevis.AAC.1